MGNCCVRHAEPNWGRGTGLESNATANASSAQRFSWFRAEFKPADFKQTRPLDTQWEQRSAALTSLI